MTKTLSYFGRKKDLHAERFIKSLTDNFIISEFFDEPILISDENRSSDVAIISPMTLSFSEIQKLEAQKIIALSLGYDLNEEAESRASDLGNILNASHEAIVDCQFSYNILRNQFNYKKPISIIPYGCDYFKFENISQIQGNRNLLVNRAWTEIHGNEIVLEALEKSSNISFEQITFVGDGPIKNELVSKYKKTIARLNIDIREKISPESMIEMYARHKFYLSAARSDGTSISLLEAMASSCIAITTDFASNLEWISPEHNGFVFENGNADALCALLSRVPQNLDESSIEAMGQRARQMVSEKGDWQNNGKYFVTSIMALNK